jgi:hypothetical protein
LSEILRTHEKFNEIRSLYERKTNTYSISSLQEGIIFLKIRSLKKKHLKKLCLDNQLSEDGGDWELRETIFCSNISEEDITNTIIENYPDEKLEREALEQDLEIGLKEVDQYIAGIRDDDINNFVSRLVRDKSIKNMENLEGIIKSKAYPTIANYIKWSWYNQNTNDILEHLWNDHEKIIPTLRKVHGIDFFIRGTNQDVPIDLKITYISNPFNEFLTFVENDIDNYIEYDRGYKSFLNEYKDDSKRKESEIIKAIFKANSVVIGGRNNDELIQEILCNETLYENDGKEALIEVINNRRYNLEICKENPEILAKFYYEDQGERLFNNNNRFYVILDDHNSFEKAWRMKRRFSLIKNTVNTFLNSNDFDDEDFMTINYFYDKSERNRGSYTAKALLVLIENDEPCNIERLISPYFSS